jgi:hypothetical protein
MQLVIRGTTRLGLDTARPVAPSRLGGRDLTKFRWVLPSALYASPLLLCMLAATAHAQEQTSRLETSRSSSLPDAPAPQVDVQSSAEQTPTAVGTASITGTVGDTSGAAIPGAQVSLTHRDGTPLHTLFSDGRGDFAFTKLPAGSYLVIINAKGFAPYTSAEFALSSDQSYLVPSIALSVASDTTEVTVRPTEVIAAEQIKAEEKQRLLGVVPNFYVSYAKDPAPLTTKQKFSLATHDTLDWTSWVGISATAGIEQANNSYAGYGQGAAGYGKRWAAKFGDGRSSDYLSHAVFASLFHQDPRYFYQGTGTTKSRLIHAVSSSFIARSDSGKNMPNYSYLLGAMTAGALSNAYYPHADRGLSLVFVNSFVGIAGRSGGAVLQEFLGKKLTKNASKSANAQP